MIPQNHILTGKKGEEEACDFLESKGYEIIRKNFSKKHGDIDLVCRTGGTTVFVEVKTRTNEKFGSPESAITPAKIRSLVKSAQYYCHAQGLEESPLRIDVVSVFLREGRPEIKHYENITGL